MVEPTYVTTTVPREPCWPLRHVFIPAFEPSPPILDGNWKDWEQENFWKVDFDVQVEDFAKANELARRLAVLGPDPSPEEEQKVVSELMKLKAKKHHERTDLEKWEHMAVQLPADIGGPNKDKIREILGLKARGRVLEAMCGFNSYFNDSPDIEEVVVLDYCKAMLERYAHHKRTRILFDLEEIPRGKTMDFFEDESFQTIGCWGSNYLSSPTLVFGEFRRILSPGGKLLIVESTTEGYADLIKRRFNPDKCAHFMEKAGLSPKVEHLPIRQDYERTEYYLVEGTK